MIIWATTLYQRVWVLGQTEDAKVLQILTFSVASSWLAEVFFGNSWYQIAHYWAMRKGIQFPFTLDSRIPFFWESWSFLLDYIVALTRNNYIQSVSWCVKNPNQLLVTLMTCIFARNAFKRSQSTWLMLGNQWREWEEKDCPIGSKRAK
jgi:hypothetical protein